jgi:4-diphosphocytidyl-2-C-methyl-D-erythritol kinase
VMMSGSGPTVFALAKSADHACQLQDHIQSAIPDPDLEVWLTQLIANGIHLAY